MESIHGRDRESAILILTVAAILILTVALL